MLWGWDELRGSLINDIGALNKVEVGEWSSWCDRIDVAHRERPDPELDDHLDSLARMVSSDDALEELQRSYQLDRRLHPPLSRWRAELDASLPRSARGHNEQRERPNGTTR